ncbi:hypothetical protein [Herbaspirillum huttiense]|uniref:Uncharacterized protein n=2 Tax=Herbaspirillum huttiense TaxID=863372 RepID=A0AAJ2LTL1_9BURK|nr:hypothetical protein [Herbaspirillum huttiense]MDR9834991.1 hypothetical protein [Herbaspirillum huttiense]
MSELQNEAKPILIRLVTGSWPDLKDDECRTIARWCAMVSLNIAKHLNIGIFTPFQLRALKYGEMPQGFHVSAIRVRSTEGLIAGYFHQHPVDTPFGGFEERIPLVSTLFCVEQTAFLVTQVGYPNIVLDMIQKYTGGLGRLPREIYPINSPASNTENEWLTPETLRAHDIEWAIQPMIPSTYYGIVPSYRWKHCSRN